MRGSVIVQTPSRRCYVMSLVLVSDNGKTMKTRATYLGRSILLVCPSGTGRKKILKAAWSGLKK